MVFHRPIKLILVSDIGLLFGSYMLSSWLPVAADQQFPIVTGTVVQRTPTTGFGPLRVDFTIQVKDPQTVVHACVQQYLMTTVPEEVRFHFSEDSSREVFLIDYEENPLWIAVTCFSISIFLLWMACRGRERSS